MPTRPDLSTIRDVRLLRFVEYWLEKRGSAEVPARALMDPLDFPWLLANVWIIERSQPSSELRIRLSGEDINNRFARNLKGCPLEELIEPQHVPKLAYMVTSVMDRPAIGHCVGRLFRTSASWLTGERVLLPLEEKGRRDLAIGGVIFQTAWSEAATVMLIAPDIGTLLPLGPGEPERFQYA